VSEASDRGPQGVVRVRADNPSPITLDGTNTYVIERWAVDPGPADDGHLEAVLAAAGGALAGIVLTHTHPDHAEGAPALAERAGGAPIVTPRDAEEVGPFRAIATPGHSQDSVCLLRGPVCFTGDTVLGEGSVFITPGGGGLAAYLDSLRRLRALELELICPGHGPFVTDPRAKIDEYLEHRLDRERRLLVALERGARSDDELLDAAWSEVPSELRPVARITLHAHLEKLRDEQRLPPDVAQRVR
jgi:glyoxylase-like metal-dependent hydrolase (beta-lactamase superfamily II)